MMGFQYVGHCLLCWFSWYAMIMKDYLDSFKNRVLHLGQAKIPNVNTTFKSFIIDRSNNALFVYECTDLLLCKLQLVS